MPIPTGISDDVIAAEALIDEPMEPEPVNFVVTNGANGAAQDALRRCAAGEITPELALSQLLARASAEPEVEAALGAAIWDALERRETLTVDRLANLQKLWNCRGQVHCDIQSL